MSSRTERHLLGRIVVPPPAGFTPFPREALAQSIPDRFGEVARRWAERTAVRSPEGALTYAELDAASAAVAAAVGGHEGGPDPVAILCDQRPSLVSAIMGALRTGRCYVPLDPSFPARRLARTIERCGAMTILATAETIELAAGLVGDERRLIDVDAPGPAAPRPGKDPGPDDVAYIYYTSGSTGEPKGVFDTHRNVLHNVLRYTNTLGLHPGDRMTLLQRPAFSGAVSSMFGAILNGATCCMFDLRRHGAVALQRFLADEGVTVYHSVPSIFRTIAAGGAGYEAMRVVRLEGDRAVHADLELFDRSFRPGCVLVNGLGATECGLVRQFVHHVGDPLPDGAPIGYPVVDMDVSVVDGDGNAVPPGSSGEIVVRSSYLASGYWDDLERTGQRFRHADDGRRDYHTGDSGRLAADGCLELLGRIDLQPRFRGQLVEVEAIDRALSRSSLAAQVAVSVHRGTGGRERLVAYVVPGPAGKAAAAELRAAVAAEVPAAGVPTDFVLLDSLPTGENGKVDLSALPPPPGGSDARGGAAYVGSRSPLEATVASAWAEVLGVETVGVHDAFADLGGDSLTAAEMLTKLEELLGLPIPHAVLLQAATVEELSAAIERSLSGDGSQSVVRLHEGEGTPVIFATGDIRGGGLYARGLAARLGRTRTVFAVAPFDPEREPTPATFEGMARTRLHMLREQLPPGPCIVAGYCAPGGLLAFELARQLEADGTEVKKVVLVDTFPIGPEDEHLTGRHRRGPAAIAVRLAARVLAWTPTLRRRIVERRAWRAFDAGAEAAWFRGVHRSAALSSFYRARAVYEPGSISAAVHVLWPSDESEHPSPEEFAAGWRRVSPRVEVTPVPGDHITAVTSELDALAAAMRSAIDGL